MDVMVAVKAIVAWHVVEVVVVHVDLLVHLLVAIVLEHVSSLVLVPPSTRMVFTW